MITVKLTCNADLPEYGFVRQTPGRSGVWGDCRFVVNEPLAECDWWVVLDDLPRPESTKCSPSNTIFFNGEPPSVKTYSKHFLRQFAVVVACQQADHPHVIVTQQSLFWRHQYVLETDAPDSEVARRGYKDYDEIKAEGRLPKSGLISLITSNKAFTPGHRKRLDFALRLKERLGDDLTLCVRREGEYEDKWKLTAPFKYHVAIENSSYQDYWTEKLADPLLFDCHPFYFGCPNIFDYFPEQALTVIDINDFDRSLALIQSSLQANVYEESLGARQEAKALLLEKYNLFPTIAAVIAQAPAAAAKKTLTLQPHSVFQNSLLAKGRRGLARLAKGLKK